MILKVKEGQKYFPANGDDAMEYKDYYKILEVDKNSSQNDIKKSYIEMKKYDGNIDDLLCYTKGDVRKTLELLLPILRALNKISKFKNPIYHRDIKPDNILFEKDGEDHKLFLTDFGICYLDKEKERLTEVEIAVGPRMFIAPEYERGRIGTVNHKGDIFSIGKVIWYMINGVENDFLPSNFWFVDEYNLVKKFANNEDIIFANNIISICLNINSEERPDYDELINLIENFLKETKLDNNERLKFEVRQYNEKRKIDLKEIREKNALLVNTFSICFVKALEKLNNYISNIKNVERVELLPYHTLGIEKYKKLNIPYKLKDIKDLSQKKLKILIVSRVFR